MNRCQARSHSLYSLSRCDPVELPNMCIVERLCVWLDECTLLPLEACVARDVRPLDGRTTWSLTCDPVPIDSTRSGTPLDTSPQISFASWCATQIGFLWPGAPSRYRLPVSGL